jgi:hypothetical protein
VVVNDIDLFQGRVRAQRVGNLYDCAPHPVWVTRWQTRDLRYRTGASRRNGEQYVVAGCHQTTRESVDHQLNPAVPHWRHGQPRWRNQPDKQFVLLPELPTHRRVEIQRTHTPANPCSTRGNKRLIAHPHKKIRVLQWIQLTVL